MPTSDQTFSQGSAGRLTSKRFQRFFENSFGWKRGRNRANAQLILTGELTAVSSQLPTFHIIEH